MGHHISKNGTPYFLVIQFVADILILQRYCVISADNIQRLFRYWVPTVYPDVSCKSISEKRNKSKILGSDY